MMKTQIALEGGEQGDCKNKFKAEIKMQNLNGDNAQGYFNEVGPQSGLIPAQSNPTL